jgi:hypothetical protein
MLFKQERRLKLQNGFLWQYDIPGGFLFDKHQYDQALGLTAQNAY